MVQSYLIAACLLCCVLKVCTTNTSVTDSTSALNIYDKRDAEEREHRIQSIQQKALSQDLMMETKWEIAFADMPMIICYLGQLVLISNIRDFDLRKNDTFKYEELGQSRFQPALVQLAISIRRAFQIAHENSNEIRMLMVEIPYRMQQISDLLLHGNEVELRRLFPKSVKIVLESSEASVALSFEIASIFERTLRLLEEIELSISATKSFTAKELEELVMKKKVLDEKKKHAEEIKKMLEKECARVGNITEHLRKKYERALDDIPTGFEAAFLGLIQSINLGEIVKTFSPIGIAKGIADIVRDNTKDEDKQNNLMDDKNALQFAENTVEYLEKFKNDVDSASTNNNKTAKKIHFSNTLAILQQSLVTNVNSMKERKPSTIKSEVTNQFKIIQTEIQTFEKKLKSEDVDIETEINMFKTSCTVYITNSNNIIKQGFNETNFNPKVKPPAPAATKDNGVGKNERYIAEKLESQLNAAQARESQLFDMKIEAVEKLGVQLAELKAINISKLNLEQIKQLIGKAIKEISKMKILWTDLNTIFRSMAIVIREGINKHTQNFIDLAKDIRKEMQGDKKLIMQKMEKDAMIYEVLKVSASSEACLGITSAYVNVSMDFVLKEVSRAVGLQALEMSKNDEERVNLLDQAENNQRKIKKYINNYRREYLASLQQQKKEIHEIFGIKEVNVIKNDQQIA